MNKLLTINELSEYIKENGVTLCKLTSEYINIPAGTKLWFALDGYYLTTFDVYTEFKNFKFRYQFDYEKNCWQTLYSGKFEVIDTKDKPEQDTQEESLYDIYTVDIFGNDTTFKRVITKDQLKKILDIIL